MEPPVGLNPARLSRLSRFHRSTRNLDTKITVWLALDLRARIGWPAMPKAIKCCSFGWDAGGIGWPDTFKPGRCACCHGREQWS